MPELSNTAHAGGRHDETTALSAALAAAGVSAPHSGRRFEEALLFGIAGGIGAGFSHTSGQVGWSSGITVAGRHKAFATGPEFVAGALERLGLGFDVVEADEARAAEQQLAYAARSGAVPIVWVHKCLVPHLALPATHMAYWTSHVLALYSIDEATGSAVVGDFPVGTFVLTRAELARARAQFAPFRHRFLVVRAGVVPRDRLVSAVRDGVHAMVHELGKPRPGGSSLESFRDFAAALVDARHPKAWARLYPGGKVYPALRDVYACVETLSGGGLHRELYSEFLAAAGDAIGNKKLVDMSRTYGRLAAQWTEFADACLPNDVAPFRETKQLWKERFSLFRRKGAEFAPKVKKHAERQLQLDQWLVRDFPLGGREVEKLLADLSKRLLSLVAEENVALGRLDAAV